MKEFVRYAAAVTCMLCMARMEVSAQRWSFGTNVMDYLNLATLNFEGGMAVEQHVSLIMGARYNPWTYRYGDGDRQFENRKQCYYAGARFWPWHVYSGWWAAAILQYQEYNRGGVFNRQTEEGDAYGAGLSMGYTLMLQKWLNLEFGAGIWAGAAKYTTYECAYCGGITDSGGKFFLWPNNVMVSLVYIF